MSQTIIGLNHSIAVKRWSATLFSDMARESYWGNRFMSKGADAKTPVQVLTELESDAGDTIKYDLFAQLRQKPTYGDAILKGKEENLRSFQDSVSIDQVRCGVNAGGKMSRKRTLHNLREISRQKMAEWWARWVDEVLFTYAAGTRGTNDDFIEDVGYTGFASNALAAPDSTHVLYGNNATSAATIGSDDTFDLRLIDRAVTKAKTMGGGTLGTARLRPIRINGEDRFVVVMHTFQEHALRTNSNTAQWIDIQKAAAAAQGQGNPLFTGAMGMFNGAILHSHEAVIRDLAGSDSLQPIANALFMGRQALVAAFGSPGSGLRFDWNEESDDRGNQVVISSSTILGVKKTRFDSKDFGQITMKTYAVDPNA
jgi:N4-gp56 family major capsid protein